MATNPGYRQQAFGDRELTVTTFTRPGFIPPSFVPPVVGYHREDTSELERGPADGSGALANASGSIPRGTLGRSGLARGGQSNPGFVQESWYELFWKDRIHILPIPVLPSRSPETNFDQFNAGNVVTEVERSFEIYNSGTSIRHRRELTTFAFDPTGQGITILQGQIVPYVLGGGESELYQYRIEASGVVNIDTDLDFTWDNGVLLTHNVTGSRVLPVTLIPQQGIRERWAWLTDVIRSQSGREQRNALREVPQQNVTYAYRFNDALDFRNTKLQNLVYVNPPQTIALPWFLDGTDVTVAITAGDSTVTVASTDDRDFRDGEDGAIIVFGDEDNFEVQTVDSFTATTITIGGQFVQSWPVGTIIYPVRFCQIVQPISQRAWAINAREMSITWRPETNRDFSGEGLTPTTYKSQPVWTDDWKVQNFPIAIRWDREMEFFESGTGLFSNDTLSEFPVLSTNMLFEFNNRAEFWPIKRWFGSRRGQQRVFWMSTRRNDLPIGDNNGTGVSLDIFNVGYTNQVFTKDVKDRRKDIEIVYNDGSIDYREVTAAIDNGTLERLTLDSASSQDLDTDNVQRISYLITWRLGADNIEYIHEWPNRGFTTIPIIEATYT